MDIFFLQLVLLFIPGIVWERVDNRFGVNRPNTQFDILRRAFCFGLTSYVALFLVVAMVNGGWHHWHPNGPRLIHLSMVAFQKDVYTLDASTVGEIVAASVAALVLSIIWLYVTNNKIPVWIMQRIGATRRFGDEDVWDFTFNSKRAEVEYVHVRDFDNQLTYAGWVEVFSETGGTCELVLRDVEVTAIDGTEGYAVPRLYLARPKDKMTIEFPYDAGKEPGLDHRSAGQAPTADGS